MRKPAFCKSKDADQLRGNRTADQRLGFCYIDITKKVQYLYFLAISNGCIARCVSNLVGNPEEVFLVKLLIFTAES